MRSSSLRSSWRAFSCSDSSCLRFRSSDGKKFRYVLSCLICSLSVDLLRESLAISGCRVRRWFASRIILVDEGLFHEQLLWLETFAQGLPGKIECLLQGQRDLDIHEAISE